MIKKIKPDDTRNLTAKVYNLLQNEIINGIYQNGDSLIETTLSRKLGVSRTPIREAIKQLEFEGIVVSVPNKGAIVKGISSKDIADIYTIRKMIEGLAARWAAEKITTEELVELKKTLDLEEFYTSKNDTYELLKLDSKFHEIIFKASKSRPLMHMLSNFHHYVQKARNTSLESPGRAKKTLHEHRAIFTAIMNKNVDGAEKFTTEHINNAYINVIK